MSEQQRVQQSAQEYQMPSFDGSAPMNTNTDVWLKASTLPPKPTTTEHIRPKTEAEHTAEKILLRAQKTETLISTREGATRHEDRPFLKEAA